VAEGARLESVYTFTGIGGSNPSLSARSFPLLISLLYNRTLSLVFQEIGPVSCLFSAGQAEAVEQIIRARVSIPKPRVPLAEGGVPYMIA
jgi:hypothetical protein